MQTQESGQLVQAVTAACEVAGLQAEPALLTKCLQLQDTMAVRFGVMLVGPAGMPVQPCNHTLLQQHHSALAQHINSVVECTHERHHVYYKCMLNASWLLPLKM